MFDRLYIDLQVALLYLAGAGKQGFAEWQCANMVNRTNCLITDIFVALLQYKCGLPQGNGFSVEIANIYAMILLLWWNMDPIDPNGTIAPFNSPRHGFPLIYGNICRHVTSLAYVDDAKRIIAFPKALYTCQQFFERVQGYCDLLAELSLVIKMGRNAKKCTLYLYNIPHNVTVPIFTSIAWSYEGQGPFQGAIDTVIMRRNEQGQLLCYDVPDKLLKDMPQNIQKILSPYRYLGITTNAQMDSNIGNAKLIHKMAQ